MDGLLAVDLGLRCGLARFGPDGRLAWYRSSHLGSRATLRRAIPSILAQAAPLAHIVCEGDRALGELWVDAASRYGAVGRIVSAEMWRLALLLPREQRTGPAAKQHADRLARRVIAWSDAPRPTSLRHDAAEAILLGLWAVSELGWLSGPVRRVLDGPLAGRRPRD